MDFQVVQTKSSLTFTLIQLVLTQAHSCIVVVVVVVVEVVVVVVSLIMPSSGLSALVRKVQLALLTSTDCAPSTDFREGRVDLS